MIVFAIIVVLCHYMTSCNSKGELPTNTIFWNDYANEDLLHIVSHVESKLRIYIYPIPNEAYVYMSNQSRDFNYSLVPRHFRSEFLFIQHLKHLSNGNVVLDPSQANVFIIDHEWAVLEANNKCNMIYSTHLRVIIDNVVDNYPYYNKSGGINHYFFAAFDKGPFCDPYCCPSSKHCDVRIFKRIENAVFIGNYGMDHKHYSTHKYNNPISTECHRAGHDIVIPQLIKERTLKIHKLFYKNMIPLRQYDSTFVGRTWFDRFPLEFMCANSSIDYLINSTEKLICEIFVNDRFEAHMNLLYEGYFSYNACGYACWSQRLYESMTSYVIPIIIADGGIQPFEKFIDWSRFTVKMNSSTWFDESLRNKYRQNIRKESEIYRNRTYECINKHFIKLNQPFVWFNFFKGNKKLEAEDYNFLSIDCMDLHDTFVYNKMKYYHQVVEWVDFNNLNKPINAWKLIQLEIYCRIRQINEFNESEITDIDFNKLCARQADYIANMEYFY